MSKNKIFTYYISQTTQQVYTHLLITDKHHVYSPRLLRFGFEASSVSMESSPLQHSNNGNYDNKTPLPQLLEIQMKTNPMLTVYNKMQSKFCSFSLRLDTYCLFTNYIHSKENERSVSNGPVEVYQQVFFQSFSTIQTNKALRL